MSTTTSSAAAPSGPVPSAAASPAPVSPAPGHAAVVTTSGPAVLGDGTTAGSRARSRWQRARWPLTVLAVLALGALLAAVLKPATSTTPLAPDSIGPMGSRALAQVLADQGVHITYVRTSGEALAAADEGSTLLVVGTYLLTEDQLDRLVESPADLVLAQPEGWHLDRLTDGLLAPSYAADAAPRPAACEDPDAVAAGTIRSDRTGYQATSPDVVLCFPAGDGSGSSSYAVLEQDGRRVVAFDDSGLMTNERVTEDGNAALMLRTLGHREHLVWYLPGLSDSGGAAQPSTGSLLPPWTGPVALQLLVLALALALWRGRALGRIVTEPLPVTVRAAETTVGRGRLYRRSRSRGHAGAALRAGTARRAAARLGLPRSAGATEVIDALARATGRPTEQVAGLLYGPPPTDDAGLLQLARQLDALESEVHRT